MNATAVLLGPIPMCVRVCTCVYVCVRVRARAVQCISSGTVKTWLSNLEKVILPPLHTHMPTVLSKPLSAGELHKRQLLNTVMCFIFRIVFCLSQFFSGALLTHSC